MALQREQPPPDRDGDQAMSVLRDIWAASGQTGPHLAGDDRPAKVCRNTAHLGLRDVDDDLRAVWRAKLEREGKLRPGAVSVRELLAGDPEPGA